MHAVLLRLNYLQTHHEAFFPQGLFPSYRQYAKNSRSIKKDDNIFFTGLVGLTLRRIRPQLSDADKIICDSIIERIKIIAPKYKNQKGRNTYNFWTTDTPKIFPNGGWLNMFDKKLALADDFDDTSIMMLVLDAPYSEAEDAHNIMQGFTNKQGKIVRTTLPAYKDVDAYSIWFGKKMVVELDPCVISNTLLMIQHYNLPWAKADSTSLAFLVKMIENKDYITHPDKMAVYYKTTAIILYHISRLMTEKPIPQLERLKPQLIEAAQAEYAKASTLPDKLILRTALLHWGVDKGDEAINLDNIAASVEAENRFIFFIANLACTFPAWLAFPLVDSGLTRFYFYCPAYNDALLLEYLAEQKKFDGR